MQLIACQFDIAWEDKPTNYEKVRKVLSGIDIQPGALIVLPEMFATGFTMNVDKADEGTDRPSEVFAAELANQYNACVIAGVVNRREDGNARNQAVVIAPLASGAFHDTGSTGNSGGTELARYDKMQPFVHGQEDRHYSAGDKAVTFDWQDHCVAPFICYDLRFPEVFRSSVREHRPTIITVIASWPAARVEHWVTLLQARAIENQAYVVGVNRCGSDPALAYPGRSLIVDYQGNVIADAGDSEVAVWADTDLDALNTYRQKLPFLNDIRHA